MRLKLFLLCVLLARVTFGDGSASEPGKTGWAIVPEIIARIHEPRFQDRDFSITDYGAVGDGETDCKSAFDKAIEACSSAGGGRVLVSAGIWLTRGPIHLKSTVNLHLEKDATVQFGTNPADYLPIVRSRFEGNEVMNFSPLIYAIDQHDVAITGAGTFDGQAGKNAWWNWKSTGAADSSALRRMGEDGVDTPQRKFGNEHHLRPNFVQLCHCQDVLIDGVTLINSPMWIVHPLLCQNVTVRGVTINSHGPNNDGCDPESCRDVLIEKCIFDTGDDCIAIKSGRGADGRRSGIPSENIVIRGCQMKDGHGGVVLGSEMSGGIRNVFVEDCTMGSPNLVRAIRLKSNSSRGGYLENLYVRNVSVAQVKEAVVRINLQYEKDRGDHNPTVRNIELSNITADKCKRPFYFVGLPNAKITNVLVENCTFQNACQPSVFEYTDDVLLRNFRLLPREGLDND
ncbi:MAG TPA: glycoside hydrolase family 28 protein [Lacipirellulaceae bacterium]|nr:glycoside hydrolase family 28 protein [Lacipirellulaceae bacterium]